MNEETLKIIGYIVGAFLVSGGALFTLKIIKNRKNNSKQSNITMTGDGNKATGGDDNSKTIINK